MDVDREWLPSGVRCWLNVHRPEDHGNVDEQRVVRDMPADANPSTEAVHEVSFLGVGRTRSDPTFLVQMACGIEVFSICSVDLGVSVEVPDVCNDDRPRGDEVAFIPVILSVDVISDRFQSQTLSTHLDGAVWKSHRTLRWVSFMKRPV
jgi:hypothetical protein